MEKQKKYVVYTVITGDYDEVNEPHYIKNAAVDLICITNNRSISSEQWEVIYVDEELDNHFLNRKIKMFPYKYLSGYDYSLYIDGNVVLKKDPLSFFERYCKNTEIALPLHLDRNCVYKEAIVCLQQKKDSSDIVDAQMARYKIEGYPAEFGLYENNLILRNHHSREIKHVMESWWNEINRGSKRDQLSLCYCFWLHRITPTIIAESTRIKNEYFDITLHKGYREFGVIKKTLVWIDMNKHKNSTFMILNSIAQISRYLVKSIIK